MTDDPGAGQVERRRMARQDARSTSMARRSGNCKMSTLMWRQTIHNFATVREGFFDRHLTFVPLDEASRSVPKTFKLR